MKGRILGRKTVEDIKELLDEGEVWEAFISIHLRLQYQLKQIFYCKFLIKEKRRQELWKILTERSIDKFGFLIRICHTTKLIDDKLTTKLKKFNKFRNNLVHKLTYEGLKITKKMIIKKSNDGLELINDLEKIFKKVTWESIRIMDILKKANVDLRGDTNILFKKKI